MLKFLRITLIVLLVGLSGAAIHSLTQAQVTPTPPNTPIVFQTEWVDEFRFAQRLARRNPGWYNALRPCPCTRTQAAEDRTHWRESSFNLNFYHPGAAVTFRSRGVTQVRGQQCAYDQNGNLITAGSGAGTPDFYAPGGIYQLQHIHYDVEPYEALGWRIYNQYWVPSRAVGCAANYVTPVMITPGGASSDPNPVVLPKAHIGRNYSQQLTVIGGSGSYTYRTTGRLPHGMSINSNGLISGQPRPAYANYRYYFTVWVEDSSGRTGSESYQIDVTAPPQIMGFELSPMVRDAPTSTLQSARFRNADGDAITQMEFIGRSQGAQSGTFTPVLIEGNQYRGKLQFGTRCWSTARTSASDGFVGLTAIMDGNTRNSSFTWDVTLIDADGNRSPTQRITVTCIH
ncbi:MAG: putative Ig domain-containing protein [Anaerolineae bacterium]|jgi:hypothetical protein|nr:putative Ig domain-containing protein [Anaerolineae bacterium]